MYLLYLAVCTVPIAQCNHGNNASLCGCSVLMSHIHWDFHELCYFNKSTVDLWKKTLIYENYENPNLSFHQRGQIFLLEGWIRPMRHYLPTTSVHVCSMQSCPAFSVKNKNIAILLLEWWSHPHCACHQYWELTAVIFFNVMCEM